MGRRTKGFLKTCLTPGHKSITAQRPGLSPCGEGRAGLPLPPSPCRLGTHTHPHGPFCSDSDTGTVCSYMFKAQAEVTSLWNSYNNGNCSKSVGCFYIKNIYFMLRLLLALRTELVYQVVTCKTKQKPKAIDPECHMELITVMFHHL